MDKTNTPEKEPVLSSSIEEAIKELRRNSEAGIQELQKAGAEISEKPSVDAVKDEAAAAETVEETKADTVSEINEENDAEAFAETIEENAADSVAETIGENAEEAPKPTGKSEEPADAAPSGPKDVALAEPKPEETAAKPAADVNNKVVFGLETILPYSIEEAVNRLRINISFLGSDVKKIMMVSSEPNEGKSFLALNLWKQMAMAGEKSILVDMDMRKSTFAAKYNLSRADGQELKGTSHYLSGDQKIEDMILHTDMECGDFLPNVDNIVNPSMLLESRKLTEMLDYMEKNYRYVFIDVPPLGLVSDAERIGSLCDGAVLCVRGGLTSRSIVRNSIRQLERAGCPLLGIVLNRVGSGAGGYYHKYYGKKYYYKDGYYSKG